MGNHMTNPLNQDHFKWGPG